MTRDAEMFVGFTMGSLAFALPLGEVVEVLPVQRCAEVPSPRVGVVGVFVARGLAVTLIDPRPYLSDARDRSVDAGRVLLVRRDVELLGLLVDEVIGIVDAANSESLIVMGVAMILDALSACDDTPTRSERRRVRPW